MGYNTTNKTVIQTLKKKLENVKGAWPSKLPEVLWAYRTTAKSSTGETPFSLIYGEEALISVEVGAPSPRYDWAQEQSNDEAMLVQLDLLKEHRDLAYVQMLYKSNRWSVITTVIPTSDISKSGTWCYGRITSSDYERGLLFPLFDSSRDDEDVKIEHQKPGGLLQAIEISTWKWEVTEQLPYEEVPIAILDRQVRRFRTKDVASVKVLWRNKNMEEMTWEAEEDMKSRHPHLFPAPKQIQTTAQSSSVPQLQGRLPKFM
ncbi:uncharacterized protein LOC132061309 [Lycium ferocissimum]|uniref:uncharacterized protein LOC132061309 n=1 Tax=Lycium ferocissimum TaxID=112874 RepID=UPI0028152E6E|nr:uncharacterized protein LOC132061309 [Lycium ferocissimum]